MKSNLALKESMSSRAYSVLQIRSVNKTERVIEGIATTPKPDRYGDIVVSEGAVFTMPMPLLWQHISAQPVGQVEFAKPTKDGIPFKARIMSTDQPGTLKNRLDEAWQSVELGLVSAVSIGFSPISYEAMYENDKFVGYRFTEWEWLELSLVTIPANSDAKIQQIRSLSPEALTEHVRAVDSETRAKLDHPKSDPPKPGPAKTSPTVTTGKKGTTMNKPLSVAERIASFEATRVAKAARMSEIMDASGAETLDAAATEEYDTLQAETKAIDEHLVRLHALEKANAKKAAPVTGVTDTRSAVEVRGGGVVTAMRSQLPPGIAFARYAMCLTAARGNAHAASEIAKSRYPEMTDIAEVLKSAVAAGSTTDPTWAGALVQYQLFAGDFVEFLRPMTILGKFGTNGIPTLRRVPFNISIPGQTSGGNGYWVGEGQPKPLTRFDMERITLRWAKCANIAVLTEELVRFSSPSAEMLVRDALAGAIVERQDLDFIDPANAGTTDVKPASILYGVNAIVSSGMDAEAIRADVRAIFGAFIAANLTPASGVWIMTNTTALALSLMRNALGQPEFPGITMMGGTFEGLPVIASQYVPSGTVALINASDIYLSDDGQVVIDASREASLQMDGAPTNASTSEGSPPAPTATQMVSMFQTNSIALRAERFINWKRRRATAVAHLSDCNWGLTGSPPA